MMPNILKKNLQEKRKILTSFDSNVNRDGIKEVAKIAICVEEGAAPPLCWAKIRYISKVSRSTAESLALVDFELHYTEPR